VSDEGFAIHEAKNGLKALNGVVLYYPDFIILDLELPDMDGFEVMCRLHEWSQRPVCTLK
jgi:DNA-binding response OmpR family regulator